MMEVRRARPSSSSFFHLPPSRRHHQHSSFLRDCCVLLSVTMILIPIRMSQSFSQKSPRTIMVTGATDGIGRHTAGLLAADKNTHLLVHGRSGQTKGEELVQELTTKGALSVQYFNADLSNLEEVEKLATDVLSKKDVQSIDVLINNAGIFDPPNPAKSPQGYDMTWAVNVMAPFVLTRRLLPLIEASRDPCPRIITTSSISQSWSLPNLDDLFAVDTTKPKSAHAAYSDSKLGDYMFTIQLAKILKSSNNPNYQRIKCLTMDPGTVNTKMLLAGWGPCGIPVRRANNTYKLATSYGAQQESGTYHFGGGGSQDGKDSKKLQDLWKYLENATGCTYGDL